MEIVEWEPERRWAETLRIVSGVGHFTLTPISSGTRVSWYESIELPLRFGGKLGERIAKPLLTAIWRRNLRSLRKQFIHRQEAGSGQEPGGLIGIGSEWEVRHYGPDHVIRTSIQDWIYPEKLKR